MGRRTPTSFLIHHLSFRLLSSLLILLFFISIALGCGEAPNDSQEFQPTNIASNASLDSFEENGSDTQTPINWYASPILTFARLDISKYNLQSLKEKNGVSYKYHVSGTLNLENADSFKGSELSFAELFDGYTLEITGPNMAQALVYDLTEILTEDLSFVIQFSALFQSYLVVSLYDHEGVLMDEQKVEEDQIPALNTTSASATGVNISPF